MVTSERVRKRSQAGFTIVELMFAIVVISIFMAAIAAALGTAMRSSRSDTNRMVTSNLAASLMDEVRATDFETLKTAVGPVDIDPAKTVIDGVQYSATRTVQWVPNEGPIVNCGVGLDAASIAFLRVDITVSWPNMGAVRPVTNTTLIAPPVDQYNTDTGAIASQVTDNDGVPQQGVTAILKKGNTTVGSPQLTSDQGCILFPKLAEGDDYTLQISKPGYVDTTGNATPVSAVTTVTSGPVTSIPTFIYDQATTIRTTLAPGTDPLDASRVAAIPTVSIPLYLANSYIQPSGWRQVDPNSTALIRSLTNLFPYRDGYSVWPGTCIDSDPDTYRADPGDPSLREPVVAVAPGETADVTLPLPALAVEVRRNNGTARVGNGVTLYYAGEESSCSGQSLTYTATTDGSGRVVVSAPYGKWRVQANGRSAGTGGWPTVEITPQNSNPAAQTVLVRTT